MKRRVFVQSAIASPFLLTGCSTGSDSPGPAKRGAHVPAGRDRSDQTMRLGGVTPTDTKVSTADTNGGMYVFEHRHMGNGGPAQHFHYAQDEWFYAIEGQFAFEVGDERFLLQPGDTIFLPRMVPHVWAHIGDRPGTILGAVAPAGTFETFFQELAKFSSPPAQEEAESLFAAHGMKIVGPPLAVE